MVSHKVVAEVSPRPLPSTSKGRVPGCATRFAENQPLEPRAAKEFARKQAAQSMTHHGIPDRAAISRLLGNGVLVERPGGLDSTLHFALDPLAEFLAAWERAEECSSDNE